MDVHIRTTMQADGLYSYIEAAAVRIGETILEFNSRLFRLNGVEHDYDPTFSFTFEEQGHTYKVSSTTIKEHKRETTIELNEGSSIKIRSSKELMYVSFEGGRAEFGDSVGMLGDYKTGEMIGRFGVFTEEDYVSYGFEWQVDPTKNDPVLFSEHREPQLPYEKCRIPDDTASTKRRRLGATNSKLHDQAVEACKEASADIDLCVLDVMATGDIDAAEMFVGMV